MSYTPPTSSAVGASWEGAATYNGAQGRVLASWYQDSTQQIYQPIFSSGSSVPAPSFKLQRFVAPGSIAPKAVNGAWEIRHPKDYLNPQFKLNASWVGADTYGSPAATVLATWSDDRYVVPVGFGDSVVTAPKLIQQQFARGAGGISSFVSGTNHYTLLSWQYAPPQWTLNASWVGKDEYKGKGATVDAAWALPQEAKQLSLTGWDELSFGAPSLKRMRDIITPAGIAPLTIEKPTLQNKAAPLKPTGYIATVFGTHKIWNWRQYVTLTGFAADAEGKPSLLGGVKYVTPSGIASLAWGTIKAVNTRATQTATPTGIDKPALGSPNVSPRILYPAGILGTLWGTANTRFPPRPVGWDSSVLGQATIEYKTKYAKPTGVAAEDLGYPKVRDRAQKIWPSSVLVSSLFGDTATRLVRKYIKPDGLDAFEPNAWAVVRNGRRAFQFQGWDSASYGAASIRNKTPSLAPQAWLSQEFGTHDVGWRVRSVYPSGIVGVLGQVTSPVLTQTPSIAPKGLAAPTMADHTIWNKRRAFDIGGYNFQKFGEPVVDFRWRKVIAEGKGIAGAAWGTPRVEHSFRSLIAKPFTLDGYGTAWVSFRRRALEPKGIEVVEMSRQSIGGTRWLGPTGFEATRWGTRIIPENREIIAQSILWNGGSWPEVQLRKRYLLVQGFTTHADPLKRWGMPDVWNRRQYIVQAEVEESLLWPPKWTGWTAIANRNRHVGTLGQAATSYGRAILELKARLVEPSGIAAPSLPEYQKTGSVTHRIRPLPLDGIEPVAMSRWAVVWNKAVPIKPAGLVAAAFGNASLLNTRRYFKFQGFDVSGYGYPFIAPRIRELNFESRYGIAPPSIPLPTVHLYSRYIEPQGMDGSVRGQSKLGLPILETHINRITTRWSQNDEFGTAALKNLTPEIPVRPWVSDEYGDTHLRLQWRQLLAQGQSTQVFGLTKIADRRQTIVVPGFDSMKIGDKLTVRKIGADPVVTQYIDLRGFYVDTEGVQHEAPDGYGIKPASDQVGLPDLSKGYIYTKSAGNLGDFSEFGAALVHANSIRVEPGYGDYTFGEPFVSLKHRTIDVPTLGQLINSSTSISSMGSWGLPRMSPHTIYACTEAPAQAIRNHVNSDRVLRAPAEGESFGSVAVQGTRGNILTTRGWASGGISEYFGSLKVYNSIQQVEAKGANMLRMGWLSVPGPQTITCEDSLNSAEFGTTEVSRPPYVGPMYIDLTGNGLASIAFGKTEVQNQHRYLQGKGFDSMAMGESGGGSGMNLPQQLYVGVPPKTKVIGFEAGTYGTPWVSHRVRGLTAEGIDSFKSEYDYMNFNKRMRVTRGATPWTGRYLPAQGFASSHVGTPGVRAGRHYIRPDGNFDNFRKGGY